MAEKVHYRDVPEWFNDCVNFMEQNLDDLERQTIKACIKCLNGQYETAASKDLRSLLKKEK